MHWTVLLIIVLGLVAAGCDDAGNPLVLSVHPLYLESDADFDPALLGKWGDDEGDVTFVFKQGARHEYKLTVIEQSGNEQDVAEFDAHLLRIGGSWFLDIAPTCLPRGSEFYRAHFVRAHTISRIWIESDNVEIAFMASSWLKKRFDDKSVDTAHETTEDITMLTAETAELQDLVDRFADNQEAFAEPIALHRIEDEKEAE